MVTIGVDAHKRMHMAQALDDAERVIDQWRGLNTPDGWRDVAAWAQGVGSPRQWGIEGAWNYGRGLAQHLVGRDEGVYDINPRWTAHERQRARSVSKNDRLDARTVALLVARRGDIAARRGRGRDRDP